MAEHTIIDRVCDMLSDEITSIRKRRATFEQMGNDDAVRAIEHDLDIVKGISEKVLMISATDFTALDAALAKAEVK